MLQLQKHQPLANNSSKPNHQLSAVPNIIFCIPDNPLILWFSRFSGGIKCVKNITLHSSSILSINAGEHWLGIGAADNSMSLFHRPSNAGTKVSGWQLYRVPQRTAAVV